MWTASAEWRTQPLPTEMELVLTLSIWILNHFLSSRRIAIHSLWMSVRIWVKESWNLMSSSAVWSEQVETIMLPWVLKLAASVSLSGCWLAPHLSCSL